MRCLDEAQKKCLRSKNVAIFSQCGKGRKISKLLNFD